jgi:hypothetical protein
MEAARLQVSNPDAATGVRTCTPSSERSPIAWDADEEARFKALCEGVVNDNVVAVA